MRSANRTGWVVWNALLVLLSACADKSSDACGSDVGRIQHQLTIGCTAHDLNVDAQGQVACRVFVLAPKGTELCGCDLQGYVATEVTAREVTELRFGAEACDEPVQEGCVCELEQLSGQGLEDCHTLTDVEWQRNSNSIRGWCYVDPAQGSGDPRLIEDCHWGRLIRALGLFEAQAAIVCGG
jgi:hypothetical protein